MKLQLFAISLLAFPVSHALAEPADPRAIALCKVPGTAFTEVADCVAGAHVAFKTLDAFDSTYPVEAKPLKDKCLELNKENISGAESCVLEAVKTAVKLKSALPADETLGDPIFEAVSDEAKYTELRGAASQARQDFDYSGGMKLRSYFPYK